MMKVEKKTTEKSIKHHRKYLSNIKHICFDEKCRSKDFRKSVCSWKRVRLYSARPTLDQAGSDAHLDRLSLCVLYAAVQ